MPYPNLSRALPETLRWIPKVLATCLPVDWTAEYRTTDYGTTGVLGIKPAADIIRRPIVLQGEYAGGLYLFADINLFPDKEERLAAMVRSIVEERQ
jgi:hypothetical protein